MPKSFSEQIASLYGKQHIPEKRIEGLSRRPNAVALHADSESRSKHLDDLHYCLKNIAEGAQKEVARIPDLAFLVGKSLLKANPKVVEQKFVDIAFDKIVDIQDPEKINVRAQLLGAAALAYSEILKENLCRVLVEYHFHGAFDKNGRFGELSRKEISYILKRVTIQKYEETLVRVGRERAAIIDQANAALVLNRENRAKNARAAEVQEILLQKKIRSIYTNLKYSPHTEQFENFRVGSADCQLIVGWTNQDSSNINSLKDLENKLSEDEIRRLWSARIGELAAIEYFKQFAKDVKDISITQIENRQKDWQTHDLSVDGLAYDVKNSRRSYSSPDSYSEHCIPGFKKERMHHSDVNILGVLSDYLTSRDISQKENGRSIILGTVNSSEIRKLCLWLDTQFSGVLETSALRTSKFFPGWIFEYSNIHQPNRTQGSEGAIEMLRGSGIEDKKHFLPKWLASFENDASLVAHYVKKQSDEIIWKCLRSLDNEIGLSKRALFLAILGITLQETLRAETRYQPSHWRDWLFADRRIDLQSKYFPLGIIDHGQYIENLIKMLQIIWNNAKPQLLNFKSFKLVHPSILKGQDYSGAWYTLIAYCGGWRSNPTAKCGKTPIHMGSCSWCKLCQHLICSECGHCSNGCVAE